MKIIIIVTKKGKLIKFRQSEIRVMGRGGQGVRAIRLTSDDEVVGIETVEEESN